MIQSLRHMQGMMMDNTRRSIQWNPCAITVAMIYFNGGISEKDYIPIRPGCV